MKHPLKNGELIFFFYRLYFSFSYFVEHLGCKLFYEIELQGNEFTTRFNDINLVDNDKAFFSYNDLVDDEIGDEDDDIERATSNC